jgi:hypothetical protein
MHCPKCGDPLAADEARFCRRCGFEIEGVKEFLTAGRRDGRPNPAGQKSFKQGIALTVACLIGILLNIVLRDAFSVPPFYGKAIIFVLMALAVWKLLVPALAEKKLSIGQSPGLSSPTTTALEPPQEYMYDTQAFNQTERLAPPEVTESTTKLLDERDRDGVALADSNADN